MDQSLPKNSCIEQYKCGGVTYKYKWGVT